MECVCPSCGYCPHCKRGGQQAAPWYPTYPLYPTYPYYPTGPIWIAPYVTWGGNLNTGTVTVADANGTSETAKLDGPVTFTN